ncbi:hypothetical protein COV82_03710 [Candidatus Peregrinibacteria bacterium CG11_big_fil_rev_8_21_14_0_20_46_8]|nr:MAG: hypothetical protein COV82_03710 [Candidatus Peregrinibacteria bacterium CG11_big_fil_rev_8_21_14_0_20_46_8]
MSVKNYIVGLGIAAALVSAPAAHAVELDLAEGLNKVIVTATKGSPGTSEFPNVFGSEGKDLYGKIYSKVRSAGTDIALEKTAGPRNLSKDELMAILPGSFIGDILDKADPAKGLSGSDVEAKLKETQNALLEELAIADLEVALTLEVTPTELFANGDEGDSGFDLLTDLDIMELILFGKAETTFGQPRSNDGGRRGGNSLPGESSTEEEAEEEPAQSQQQPTGPQRPQPAPQPSQPQPSPPQQPSVATEDADEIIGDIVCAVDQNLHDAVEAAREAERNRANNQNNNQQQGGNTQQNPNANAGAGQPQQGGGAGTQPPQSGRDDPNNLGPRYTEETGVPFPCNDVFCLEVDLIYRTDSSYTTSEHCVACHVEKINDLFKKTMSKSLLPNKASGNLFELPMCKGGDSWSPFSALSFNLVLVPNPIVTPPNDDLITEGSFVENARIFIERYFDKPDRCKGGECKSDPQPRQEAAQRALDSAGDAPDQAEILRKVEAEVRQRKAQQRKVFDDFQNESLAKPQSLQYQVLLQEMDTMNNYFKSFRKLFQDIINLDDPASPCRILRDKPSCSS